MTEQWPKKHVPRFDTILVSSSVVQTKTTLEGEGFFRPIAPKSQSITDGSQERGSKKEPGGRN